MRALAPNIPTTPLIETIAALCHLHPLVEVDHPPFVDDFHPKTDGVFNRKTFIFVLTHFTHLSFGSPSSMVYELLWDCFVPNDFIGVFEFFLTYVSTSLMVMFFHQYLFTCCIATIGFR